MERRTSVGRPLHGDAAGPAVGDQNAGEQWLLRFGSAFPEAYKEDVSPWVAAFDVENANAVADGERLRMSLYRPRVPRGGIIRFKLFRMDQPIPLSNILPVLENLGLHVVNERPYELPLAEDRSLWIQDFDMIPAVKRELDLDVIRERFQEAFGLACLDHITAKDYPTRPGAHGRGS